MAAVSKIRDEAVKQLAERGLHYKHAELGQNRIHLRSDAAPEVDVVFQVSENIRPTMAEASIQFFASDLDHPPSPDHSARPDRPASNGSADSSSSPTEVC